MKKFPDGFLWGSSTASYQVEGGNDNTDWAEAARQGKVPVAGLACDHYNRFEEDWDIAKSLHFTSQRFSIEWARIEPEEGVFNDAEMEHYKQVVSALRARGIEPFVTIWHWTMPTWLSDKGGITYEKWPELLGRYAGYVAKQLGSDVRFFITINEPMVVTGNGYLPGIWPPFKKNPLQYLRAVAHVIRGHKEAHRAIKKEAPGALVGVSQNYIPFEGTNIVGSVLARIGSWWYNDYLLNSIKNFQDFIALNHYFRVVFWQNKKQKNEYPRSDFGWELYPPAMYSSLMGLKKYNVPIYISENGLADATDSKRKDFLLGTLDNVHRAIHDGVDVRGYSHWSLLDNYEWAEGYTMRFGLVHVDFENGQKRTIRESARVYADIAKQNALP